MKPKQLNKELLSSMMPECKNPNDITTAFNELSEAYELNTVNRVAGFLAQCGHESNSFNVMKENLNYSSEGLQKIFGKYFPTKALADAYARKPEKIANKVYGNRFGNGIEASGDGFRYSGKGFIQLTFKNNYVEFAKSINKTLEETVQYVQTVKGAMESAMWYWKTRKVNFYCDKNDIIGMTKIINGGTHGLDDRTKRYEKYKKALS